MIAQAKIIVALMAAILMAQASPQMCCPVDEKKPYLYLSFEKIATRTPIRKEENSQGLWLRLHNNSCMPVSVKTFQPSTNDQEVDLYDEVIKLRVPIGNSKALGSKAPKTDAMPKGYSSSDVFSSRVIKPGENLLFSVPLNHVSSQWYLRVYFLLGSRDKKAINQPTGFVEFYWTDIPTQFRDR